MVEPGVLNRIVFAKYLLWQGHSTLESSLPVSDGLAVLSYQDAAEMLLRATAEHVNAGVKDQATFDHIITQKETAPNNKKQYKVLHRTSLNQLNKARVNFKHYGLLPVSSDVQKFRRDLESFFSYVISTFFGLQYDEVSLADLIEKRRIVNHLKHSEKMLREDKYEDSIISSAKAFALNVQKFGKLDIGYSKLSKFKGELDDAFGEIKTHLERHQFDIDLLKYGINLAEYGRFQGITPSIMISMAGTFSVTVWWDANEKQTKDNAQFCLRFAIDSGLRIQRYPYHSKLNWLIEPRRRFKVTRNDSIIVYPDAKEVEIIRQVEKGEVLPGTHQSQDKDEFYAVIQDDECAYISRGSVKEIALKKK